MKKFLLPLLVSCLLILLAYVGYFHYKKSSYVYDPVPTFYFHGYSGTANSTSSMISYAKKNYGAHKVLTATVSSSGSVKLSGSWDEGTDKPLIQVIVEDNISTDMDMLAIWYSNVIEKVKSEHDFESYNTVAHSMGNSGIQYLLIREATNADFPKLNREVVLAAPINGDISLDDHENANSLGEDGYPKIVNKNYEYYIANIDSFPKNQIDILNIYGNLEDGSDSDGSVTTVAAKSLKYLANKYAKSYEEVEIKGEDAQHSKLHENSQVDKLIGDFLWQKKSE
ncbi:alpha/beta hydrolase [Streptococcaceae bacterium ESL0687]|nr:alpha/beta hydrolase [Streptococcaceae bacterium ESL0687]